MRPMYMYTAYMYVISFIYFYSNIVVTLMEEKCHYFYSKGILKIFLDIKYIS